jgi:GRIP domain
VQEYLDQITSLTEECDALKLREKQLLQDIKKRGDLARQMLAEKDRVIGQLKSGGVTGASSTGKETAGLSPTASKYLGSEDQASGSHTVSSGSSHAVGLHNTPSSLSRGLHDTTEKIGVRTPLDLKSHSASSDSAVASGPVSASSSASSGAAEKSGIADVESTESNTVSTGAGSQASQTSGTPLSPASISSSASISSATSISISSSKISSSSSSSSSSGVRDRDRDYDQQLVHEQIAYLKQAFCGFVKAKEAVEMKHLGRVICAILKLNAEEQHTVMDSIERLTPAVVATSTFESFSSNFSSLFA